MRNNPGGLPISPLRFRSLLKSNPFPRAAGLRVQKAKPSQNDGDEPTCPIVVLVNEGTANAAGSLGALQDNGRAVIQNADRKGSVQTVIPMEGGAAEADNVNTIPETIHRQRIAPILS
jgi:carboxyl-terminal processing protease